jgi:DNA replication protein DnaC
MIEATMEKLLLMKLYGMAEGLREQMNTPEYGDLGFEERCALLVDKEKLYRENRLLKTLVSKAHFRHPSACFENIDFRVRRSIVKDALFKLCQNDWIRSRNNLILVGATGVGKTYIACALGNAAVRQGISTLYVRMPRLAQDLKVARADGSYAKLLCRLQRMRLLIVDDWGLNRFTDEERRDFLEIMEDRHQTRSTIIATQLPVDLWHDAIGDPTFADAICDRIVHNAHKIILTGDSMRKRHSELT